ncbi:receptor-like protein 6 [Carya illinoinensis]|nr:receptor-like protein 6 [Carya illinoinensis]
MTFGQCLGDQQSLLLQLKNNLEFEGELSTKLVHWNENSDCCLWEGVTCSEGRVIGLDLSSEAISDGLDDLSSLFGLQYLQNLSLANNYFNDLPNEFPSELDRLTNLICLNLSNAGFIGQIPIAISRLTRLVVLDLSMRLPSPYAYDQPFYEIPLIKLENPNLKMLVQNLSELIEIHLDGTFPKKIFQLPMIEILDLSLNNLLGGSLPDFPSNGYLQTLRLSHTEFSGVLPDSFGKLTMLSTTDLRGCDFSVSIPESMASLTQLVYLDLSQNHFSGSIPESMASLTQLVYLDLSNNHFSGPILSFSMAKNLNQIYLSNNDLTGHITPTDWAKFQNLEVLDLGNNLLTGNIPVSLFSLPLLQRLILSNNSFSGQLNEFSNVSSDQLREVDLGSNNLEGPIPMSVFELRGLETLSLASNNFIGSLQLDDMIPNALLPFTSGLAPCKLKRFPDFLRNQSKLSILDLSDNQIHGDIPNWIWIPSLLFLNLSHNYFVTLQGPLTNVSWLKMLYLQSNQLQGPLPVFTINAFVLDFSRNNFSSIPANIGNILGNIDFLYLSSNKFNRSIPASLCNILELRVLDMSYNSLSGIIPHCLFEMVNVAVLNLEGNNLSGKISDTCPGNCSLHTLTLNGNQLEGGLPKSLDNCQSLQVLDLGNNHIQDIFPCYLKNISSLRVLVLRSNKFYGSIGCPGLEATWPMLQIIDLASNNFSGNLPSNSLAKWKAMMSDGDGAQLKPDHLGFQVYYQDTVTITMKGRELKLEKILTIFTSIDFSCNDFQGPIPEELGGLKYLYILNLSHNAFTGQISSTLGKLSNLESLDLSSNKLTGEIPLQLANGLIFLSVLSRSFNQLVGKIPLIKQFATFSEISYEGNKGLCGSPLKEKCNDDEAPTSSPPIFEETHSNSGILVDWNFLSAKLGFVFGFGIVIGPLMFWKQWRFWYSKQIDDILFKIFPKLYLGREYRRRAAHRN